MSNLLILILSSFIACGDKEEDTSAEVVEESTEDTTVPADTSASEPSSETEDTGSSTQDTGSQTSEGTQQ